MGGLDAWITKYGVNYTFYQREEISSANDHEGPQPEIWEDKKYNLKGHRVLLRLQNHNPHPTSEGKEKQEGYYNYFIGNDDSKYATHVGRYQEAVVRDVYEGIDLRYYFDEGALRYDYIVHAGADPSQIAFTLEGSDKTYVNDRGDLVFSTCFGEVALAELRTYQGKDRKEVKSSFVQKDGNWTIALASYDRDQALIIDPLVYSTFVGGGSDEYGRSIVVDGSGHAYITGETYSTDYDITPGAFQTTTGGDVRDVFVTKLNASGTALVYSTYIGGNGGEYARCIAVDYGGEAYITGYTWSTDYAITAGAYQTTNDGNNDILVTKLNASGTALVYSTYIGGSDNEYGYGIVVGANS